MEQEILPRLNELAKIAKQRALTPEEETERAAQILNACARELLERTK